MAREVLYQGLLEIPVLYQDNSKDSLEYFRISQLPTEFTAGKNLFSFKCNPRTFLDNSPLYVEVLDSAGYPIYTEVNINAENDDQYAEVSVFIDSTTAPGPGTVILCGIIDTDANGNQVNTNNGVNIRWNNSIQIYPSKRNTSEIVFSSLPIVSVTSSLQPYVDYFYPSNGNRFTSSFHTQLDYLLYNNTAVLVTSSLSIPFTPSNVNGTIYISSSDISKLIPAISYDTTILSASIASFINSGSITLTNPLLLKQSNSNTFNEFRSATLNARIIYEQSPYSSSLNNRRYNLITANFSNLEPTSGTVSRIKSYYKQTSVGEYILFNESDITKFEPIYGYTTSSLSLRLPLHGLEISGNTDFKFEFINPDGTPSNQVVVSKNHLTYNTANTGSTSGVTQIIAGTNVTLSPADGKGIVTINASTGGGGSGVPNGPNYSLQYNNGGNFSGSGNFTLLNNNALYLTGSFNVSGSTIQRGNNTLVGTTTLTGSILINGDIIPQVSSSFDLGSITNPWRSIYVQSGSISIQSDIPGGPPAVISNANGNVSIAAAGLQLKSGSFIPFEVSTTARTVIRVPDLPANDIGGLSIIGSSDGSYQPITNAGGLLHLTSNDGASSRITSDAFGTTAVAAYVGRKARGTAATPLPVQAGDTLTRISTVGWTGPEYGFTMSASAVLAATAIETIALDNFTTSSFGTRFQFYNAPSGSTIRTLSATIDTTGITIPSSSRFFGTASWAISASQAISSSYTLSSSYALNGGVTQLLAGPNVTLSPTNGKGQVTISATLSGSTIFNTSTGSYSSFYDTTTQTNPVGDVPRSMSLNTTAITNGVAISGSTSPFNTYIKTTNAGVYNIQFSAQLDKTDSGTDEIIIWLRKNGSDLTDTATTVTLVGNNAKNVSAWNWFVNSAANDYYQIIWQSADTNVRLFASGPAGGHPGIPSVIVTVNRVDQFLSNTGSFSGSFTGQLFGTSSWSSNAVTASYIVTAQTASYVLNAVSSSFAVSSSRAVSSSYALSSSYSDTAASVPDYETPWIPYVPTWTSFSGINPTLNDGTITGNYKVIGKICFVRVKLNFGSLTNGGSGAWLFGLPVPAASPDGIQFPCSILDNTVAWYGGTVNGTYSGLTDKTAIITPQPSTHTQAAVTATSPFTWGNTDSLQFNGSYEAL